MFEEPGEGPLSGSGRLERLSSRWSALQRQGLMQGQHGIRLGVLLDLVEEGLDEVDRTSADAGEGGRIGQLNRVADEYGSDAKRHDRTAQFQYFVALLFAVLAILVAGTVLTLNQAQLQQNQELVSRFAVAGLLLAASLPFFLVGARYRKSASESRRLELQFRAFEPYIKGFVGEADVMRAALAPRLFSRIMEDDDPIREPSWPKLDR